MSIRLIGLDLDGTLLTRGKRLSPRTANALTRAADRGAVIVYLTGRPLSGVMPEILHGGVRYVISSNGAVTTELKRKTTIRARLIPPCTALAAARIAIEAGVNVTAFCGGAGYCEAPFYNALMEEYRQKGNIAYGLASRRPVEDILAFIRSNAEGFENLCLDTNEADAHEKAIAAIADLKGLRHVTTRGNRGFNLELGHAEADKGLAFEHIAEALGIDRSETMAIGDDGNDIGLLKSAGVSVAMGNAADAVIRICRYKTSDNDHDGAALAIERFVLN